MSWFAPRFPSPAAEGNQAAPPTLLLLGSGLVGLGLLRRRKPATV